MLQELARRDRARQSGSLAQRLELNVPLLHFSITLTGRVRGQKQEAWAWLLGDDRALSATRSQALHVDQPPPEDFTQLPAWLARTATWSWDTARVRTNLRGKHRAAMLAWLKGDRPSPAPD